MSLKQRIEADLKSAMKARDRTRLDCLRMLKARLQEREVAVRTERGSDAAISDDEEQAVVTSYAKQRRDSVSSYRDAGREDLASREAAELAIVEEYLPRQLSEDEIREIVRTAIAEASLPRDMGAVMQLVMPKVRGIADGKLVNRIVRELLSAG